MAAQPGSLTFLCNICGSVQSAPMAAFTREDPSCAACGSSVRLRSIVHGLSIALWGQPLLLSDFPERPGLRGIGLSDWAPYANRLAAKLGYRNTFYDRQPRLDITGIDPSLEGTLDFLISTDVFEHVAPPVDRAFVNARRLLKPTGVMVFSVPFQLDAATIEHFPNLHDYALHSENGRRILKNRTRDGTLEEFHDLRFHGGIGSTLEMRIFGQQDLMDHLARAGFEFVFPLNRPYFEFGIVHISNFSYPLLASPQPVVFDAARCFDWVTPAAVPFTSLVPAIAAWGPHSAATGAPTTLWFTGALLRASELIVRVDDRDMDDAVTSDAADTLTCSLPASITSRPGEHRVEVWRSGQCLMTGMLTVRDTHSATAPAQTP